MAVARPAAERIGQAAPEVARRLLPRGWDARKRAVSSLAAAKVSRIIDCQNVGHIVPLYCR